MRVTYNVGDKAKVIYLYDEDKRLQPNIENGYIFIVDNVINFGDLDNTQIYDELGNMFVQDQLMLLD